MISDAEKSAVYAFEGFRLDTAKRRVYGSDGKAIPLKAKAFETLLFLVENSGRVIERDELLAAIWPDTVVEENNLTQHISSLRRMFGEKPDEHRFIATVPGRGYMFVADVRVPEERSDLSVHLQTPNPRKRFLLMAGIVGASLLVLGFLFSYQPVRPSDRRIRSIAVLPFKPLSEQNRNESLEWGMTNELIDKLAAAEGLDVRPLSSVRRFVSPEQNATEAGHELNVDVVLDGSIQTSGNRVRVKVKLINVADSRPLWVVPFEEEFTDIFALQEKVAERVARELEANLGTNARKRYTDNADAHKLYWEGRYYQLKLAPRFVDIAIEKYQKAIDLDQNFALAWTGISDSHRGLILSGEKSPAEESKLAVEAANKALAIDPQLAEAHLARALAYFWLEHDWSRAEAEFKRSLELDPKSAVTRANYAHMLSNMGRHDQAISEIRTAREQDSYSANWLTYDGIVHLQAGQLDAAFARFEDAKRMDRELWLPHFFEAQAYTDLQRSDEALASARKATDINDSQSISTAYECVALARLDRRDEAEKVFDELLRRNSERYVPPYHLAIAYMGLDKREEAVRWLEKSYVEGDVKIVFLKADRIWDPIRSETRFVELITKLNLPQ